MNNTYTKRIISLYESLDRLDNSSIIHNRLAQEVNYLVEEGFNKKQIYEIFYTELLTEQQNNSEMIAAHTDYMKMVEAILG